MAPEPVRQQDRVPPWEQAQPGSLPHRHSHCEPQEPSRRRFRSKPLQEQCVLLPAAPSNPSSHAEPPQVPPPPTPLPQHAPRSSIRTPSFSPPSPFESGSTESRL